jgi:hemin uptake protein HemP
VLQEEGAEEGVTTERKPRETGRPVEEKSSRVVQAGDLFQGEKTLIIEHRGTRYVLRETRNGKLILTK